MKNTKKLGLGEVFKLAKKLLEPGLARANFNECLGELVSNKSVKYNATDSREYLSLCQKIKLNMMIVITIMILLVRITLSAMMLLVF